MEKWAVIKHYRDILASEEGYILKNGSIKVATLYPNKYEIASQNLGFQEVYKFLNSIEDVVCERIVLDFYEDNLSIE
ncbi:MAG: radical SAM protein, partial [Deferribacterales bacterium]|nr:radical SAM protein [Deferribacterales bacterium]